MGILNNLFGNKEIEAAFIDGKTTFILSSNPDEGGNVFQNSLCKLIRTIKNKGESLYLIRTDQDYTGLDFGLGAVKINDFIISIRRPSSFKVDKENDVIVYLPNDIDSLNDFGESMDDLKAVNWATIHDIKN